MKKLSIIFLIISISFTVSYAQRVLEAKEKTEGMSVFTDKDTSLDSSAGQAGVTISCPTTLSLTFSSNLDKKVDVYKTEEKGGLRYYYLRFIVGRYRGASYDNRILEIITSGFLPLKLPLNLSPSQSRHFEVFDPNATVGVGCFYQNYNEGVDLFKKAMYSEAQEKYKLALVCTDAPPEINVKEKIANIDSILLLRRKADQAYDLMNYKEAIDAYQRIIAFNSDDLFANRRALEIKVSESCKNYFKNAEDLFFAKKYDEAKKLYEILLEQDCPQSNEAKPRLITIKNIEERRKERAQAILYEYAIYPNNEHVKNLPIGISSGHYYLNKVGSYFSLGLNMEVFHAMLKNHDKSVRPEVNVSFGLNFKIVKPVWLFGGIGYTGVGSWEYEGHKPDDPGFLLHSALSPEAGLLGKIGPLVLRYTFQYRFALEKDFQDYIGQNRHVFGVGICF